MESFTSALDSDYSISIESDEIPFTPLDKLTQEIQCQISDCRISGFNRTENQFYLEILGHYICSFHFGNNVLCADTYCDIISVAHIAVIFSRFLSENQKMYLWDSSGLEIQLFSDITCEEIIIYVIDSINSYSSYGFAAEIMIKSRCFLELRNAELILDFHLKKDWNQKEKKIRENPEDPNSYYISWEIGFDSNQVVTLYYLDSRLVCIEGSVESCSHIILWLRDTFQEELYDLTDLGFYVEINVPVSIASRNRKRFLVNTTTEEDFILDQLLQA